MKANKLFKKLALSGVALGAAAVTLTATTFAWYTSNTSVEVQQISGMTEATAGSSDIFVAAAQTYGSTATVEAGCVGQQALTFGDYKAKVAPVLTGSGDSTQTLKPVSYIDGSETPKTEAYLEWGSVTVNSEANTPDTINYKAKSSVQNVYEYVLRFRTASSTENPTPLYFKSFNLTSEFKAGAEEMVALAYGGTTGIGAAGVYKADLLKSLKLTVIATPMTNASTLATSGVATKIYDLKELATTTADSNVTPTATNNALGYVNTVLGYDIVKPTNYLSTATKIKKESTATATNAESFASIATSGYVEVRFIFWLDGWDNYCYDVMRQQKFTFSFEADTSADHSVISTVTE